MGGRFAGSGSLDERRRRRLASRAEPESYVSESAGNCEAELHEVEEDKRFNPGLVRLCDLTPSDIWKTTALITAVIFLAVGTVVASHDPGLQAGQYGDAVAHFFDLGRGQAIRFLSIATLISAAHFALVIRTVRSRSPRDFRGRFRIWRWAAGLFVGGATLIGTDLHLVFSDLIHQFSGITYHGWVRLNWLIPLCIVATVITWKLWIDMSLCRSSKLFLGLAVISAGALMFADQISEATGYAHVTLISQLAVGVCLFAAMLLHMRFVSHVNPNPPEPKALRETPNTAPQREEEFSSPAAAGEKPVKKKAGKKQSPKRQTVAQSVEDYDEFEEEAPQPLRRKRTRREGPAPDSLKGMTKKERKLARKAFREEQRAMEKGYDA
ncbi:MAG: hypothetical protein AB8G99_11295 [Planctomycetaceae bacterium]